MKLRPCLAILFVIIAAAIASATVGVYPTGITFPSQAVGTTGPVQYVSVYNVGTNSFTVNTASVNISQFKVVAGTLPFTLAPNEFETFQLQFTPDAARTFSGVLTFTFIGAQNQVVNLTGYGINVNAIPTLSATSLNFANQALGKNGPSQTLTVTNNGTSAVSLTGVTVTAPFSQLGWKSFTTIQPGSSFSMSVSFVPSALGAQSGMLMMTFDQAPTSAVSLWGSAVAATKLGITSFPTLPLGTTTFPYQASVTASGGTPPYTWSVGTGSLLPAGLTLSSDGVISGTIASTVTAGNHSFTVKVSDSATPPAFASLVQVLSVNKGIGAACNNISFNASDGTPLVPLTDLGTNMYLGAESGGLYANGSNSDDPGHQAFGVGLAGGIQPLDSNGNVVVAGYFSGSVDLGGGVLTSAGGYDIFLAKYSAAGIPLWSKRFGGTGNEQVTCIALDGLGNIFLGGSFTGSGNFGGANWTSTSAWACDAFLAKYDSQGNPLWSQGFGGTSADVVNSIAVDSQGNLVATGFFLGTANFGGTTVLSSVVSSTDAFLAKYSPDPTDPTGARMKISWAKNFPNMGSSEYGNGVAVDKRLNPVTGLPYDNILLCGHAISDIDFGGGRIEACGFLAKFLPSGDHVWSRACGTNNIARPWAMAIDSNGDVALSGDFLYQTDLGGGVLLGTSSLHEMFLAKYSGANGNYMWSRAITGNLNGAAKYSMVADAQNNIILTGGFRGTFNFGAQSLTTTGSDWSVFDGFVAKYSPGSAGVPGTPLWAKQFGGTGNDYGCSIAVDSAGHLVVTGNFEDTANFAGQYLTSAGASDIVVGWLDP